ncbi:MAG: cell envelope integrity protein CreD, partial [Treponema sp.]|nr:cell envelope integrity protein CreD [Treponema sp.]
MSDFNADQQKQKKAGVTSSGGFKIVMLVILILLLLIPISMIRSLISERSHRANTAEESIMEAWGSQLTLYGPVIRIPVVEREEVKTKTEKDGEKIEIIMHDYALWITPKDMEIRADFSSQKKRRGIFSVALFSGDVSLSGNFTFERAKGELKQNQTMYPQQAEIIIGLASQKGIRRIIKADWNGSELFFKPGNRNYSIGYVNNYSTGSHDSKISTQSIGENNNGINASSPFDTTGINTFDIKFAVQGGKSIRALPVGETTHAYINADWPSPSYQGGFLPASHTFSESGFNAEWEISYLSRSIPLYWLTGRDGFEYDSRMYWGSELFGVDFFKPL